MNFFKSARFHCLLIFTIALFVRVLYLYHIHDVPLFDEPTSDAKIYTETGLKIAGLTQGRNGYGTEAFFYPPLMSHFLGLLFSIFGKNLLIPRIMQAVLGALTCLQIYWFGRTLFCSATGFIAGLIGALFWVFLFFNGELLATTLQIFLSLFLLQVLLLGLRSNRKALFFAVGILFGLSALTRPTILPFGLALVAFFLLRKGLEKRLAATALFLLGALVTIGPVTARNALVDGNFTLICSNGAINFYIGNNPEAEKTIAVRPFSMWRNLWSLPEKELGRFPLTMKERERFWMKKGFSYILSNPISFLQNKLKMLAIFWHSYEVKRNVDLYFFREFSWLLLSGVILSFGTIAPLGLAGIFMNRKRLYEHSPLLLFIVVHMLSISLFFVCSRYRLPVVPILIVYAAYALQWFWKNRGTRTWLSWLGVALLLGLFINLDFLNARNEDPAENHLFLSEALLDQGDLDGAQREIEKSLSLNPQYGEAFLYWGKILFQKGLPQQAEEKLKVAIRLCPENATAHGLLGRLYMKGGHLVKGVEIMKKALKLLPNQAVFYTYLGFGYNRLEKFEDSEATFLVALRLEPENEEALFGLADTLTKKGKFDEAEKILEKLISLYPNVFKEVNVLLHSFPPQRRQRAMLRLWEVISKK